MDKGQLQIVLGRLLYGSKNTESTMRWMRGFGVAGMSDEMQADYRTLVAESALYSDAIGFVVDEIIRIEDGIREHGSEQDPV